MRAWQAEDKACVPLQTDVNWARVLSPAPPRLLGVVYLTPCPLDWGISCLPLTAMLLGRVVSVGVFVPVPVAKWNGETGAES